MDTVGLCVDDYIHGLMIDMNYLTADCVVNSNPNNNVVVISSILDLVYFLKSFQTKS